MNDKIKLTQVGSSLYVYDEAHEAEVERAIEKKLVAGELRVDKGGVQTYYVDEALVDTSKEGAEQYTWDSSGNRIKHSRYRITRKGSEVSKVFTKYVYKAP